MIMTTITLEGKVYEIEAPKFKDLRKIIGAFNLMVKAGLNSDSAMESSSLIFSILIGKSIEEIDEMRVTMPEMTDALGKIPEICGLELVEKTSGEAQVAETDSTKSTAT
jgi:hypothetical protein